MNITIRNILLFLFLWGCRLMVQGQTVLLQNTHLPREGDVILKQELQYKSPGRSGSNVIWDFSELSVLDTGYREYFTGSPDSILMKVSPRSRSEYKMTEDSLFCIGYQTSTLQIKYLLPELYRHYPMFYRDSISSLYYGEGKYSHTLNMAVYGISTQQADAYGTILLPDGDTLTHVLRIRESTHASQRLSSYSDILSCGNDSHYSTDSLHYRLSHDSITWQTDTYRWYASGYRYPVFETVQTSIITSATPTRHFYRSYYYPLKEQIYLPKDRVNMNIRERIAMKKNSIVSPSPDSFIKQDYTYNYFIDENGNTLQIELLSGGGSDVELALCSLAGYCIEKKQYVSIPSGLHKASFNISSLSSGNYLLSVIVDGNIHSEKIFKK